MLLLGLCSLWVDLRCEPKLYFARLQVSGRSWKAPSVRASTLKCPTLATSWEKKMAVKAASKAYKAGRVEARTTYRENIEVSIFLSLFLPWEKTLLNISGLDQISVEVYDVICKRINSP